VEVAAAEIASGLACPTVLSAAIRRGLGKRDDVHLLGEERDAARTAEYAGGDWRKEFEGEPRR